jgi:hypothetical protein
MTVVRFKAETTPKSFQGKIKIAVTLGEGHKHKRLRAERLYCGTDGNRPITG